MNMTKYALYAVWMLLAALLQTAPADAGERQALNSRSEKNSYAIGVEFVQKLQRQPGEINLDLVIRGMKDVLANEGLLMTESDINRVLGDLRSDKATRQQDTASQALNAEESAKPTSSHASEKPADDGQEKEQLRHDVPDQFAVTGTNGRTTAAAADVSGQIDSSAPQTQPVYARSPVAEAGTIGPNGAPLSRRNQAKLNAAEMKREMRAAAIAAGSGN